jgi:hypothetical protein
VDLECLAWGQVKTEKQKKSSPVLAGRKMFEYLQSCRSRLALTKSPWVEVVQIACEPELARGLSFCDIFFFTDMTLWVFSFQECCTEMQMLCPAIYASLGPRHRTKVPQPSWPLVSSTFLPHLSSGPQAMMWAAALPTLV